MCCLLFLDCWLLVVGILGLACCLLLDERCPLFVVCFVLCVVRFLLVFYVSPPGPL